MTLKSSKTEPKISDYAPKDSEANVVPFIRGTVLAESIEPYRVRKRLNDTQKLALGILAFLTVFVTAVLLLPWAFKFALILCAYLFIGIVTKTDIKTGYSRTPNVKGGSGARIPGSAIVPRS